MARSAIHEMTPPMLERQFGYTPDLMEECKEDSGVEEDTFFDHLPRFRVLVKAMVEIKSLKPSSMRMAVEEMVVQFRELLVTKDAPKLVKEAIEQRLRAICDVVFLLTSKKRHRRELGMLPIQSLLRFLNCILE